MATKTYKATIRIKNKTGGSVTQQVNVQADNYNNARAMLEAQYGTGCIVNSPTEVR